METVQKDWRYQLNDDQAVVLQSKGVSFRWPNGGFVWKRPSYVFVEGVAGETRQPVYDITRIFTVGLYAMSAFMLLLPFFNRKRGQ